MLQSCVCGSDKNTPWATVSEISLVTCADCGIRRVAEVDVNAYSDLYKSGAYHTTGSVDTPEESAKRGSHNERLAHDIEVAHLRMQKLRKYSPTKNFLIDVGCANGAFMLAAKDHGFDAVHGVDLSDQGAPENVKPFIHLGELQHLGFQRKTADVITFNDSFEHFIDPVNALKAARGILKNDGILVVEVPDMGCAAAKEQGDKFVHVKPHEHLWYFTANQLRDVLETNGFNVVGMDTPIPGKVTAYACPQVFVEEVEVHGPAGVGDIIWIMNKFAEIRRREAPCKLKYVVCCDAEVKIANRAEDFVMLSELVDSMEFRPLPLPTDTGCDDPRVPVYRLLANDYLDPKQFPWTGKSILDWHPELGAPDFDLKIKVPQAARDQVYKRLGQFSEKYIAVYMSSHVWNGCTLVPHWTTKDWADLIIRIADSGYKPVILGAGWDGDFAKDVAIEIVNAGREPSKVWINTVGRTPLPLAMAYMECAQATIGIAAGLPIIGAYMGWNTVIMWPVRGVSEVEVTKILDTGYCSFAPEFPTNWVPPEVMENGTYDVLRVGEFDSTLAAARVVSLAWKLTKEELSELNGDSN